MRSTGRFQFNLRDLFWGITLIGIGMSVMLHAAASGVSDDVALVRCLLALTIIGAGIGAPFHQKAACGLAALTISFIAILALFFLLQGITFGD